MTMMMLVMIVNMPFIYPGQPFYQTGPATLGCLAVNSIVNESMAACGRKAVNLEETHPNLQHLASPGAGQPIQVQTC